MCGIFAQRQDRARDGILGREIAAHGIESDLHGISRDGHCYDRFEASGKPPMPGCGLSSGGQ